MSKLTDLLEEKLKRIEEIPAKFVTETERTQAKVFRSILRELNKLQLDADGEIILNNFNLGLIETIGEKYRTELYGQGYTDSLTEFAKQLDAQKQLNIEFITEAIGDFNYEDVFERVYQRSKRTAVELLSEAAVNDAVDDFKILLQDSIANSDTFADMVDSISVSIQGSDTIDGRMVRYARQNALDLYAGTERTMTKVISDSLGIEWFEYAGGLMTTTREFCRSRAGKTYHKKEIEDWASKDWQGKARGTTSSTIFSLAGGYNCNHDFIPKDIRDVPTSAIIRNIENGNVKRNDLPESIQNRIK